MSETNAYKRVILKLSGESFAPNGERGITMDEVNSISLEILEGKKLGCQIGVVIGGGNILRGSQFTASNSSITEATAHYMGMLATVINGLAMQDALESIGCDTRLMSAIKMDGVCEPYIRRRADRHLRKNRVIILAAGTGGPFVTTDTAAALRSLELGADILMKATRVDGVYSDDPEKNPHAIKYQQLSYQTVLEKGLRVMDSTAIAHCMEREMPVMVFNFQKPGNIKQAISGNKIGTVIGSNHETVTA